MIGGKAAEVTTAAREIPGGAINRFDCSFPPYVRRIVWLRNLNGQRADFGLAARALFGDNWIFGPVVHDAVYLSTGDATMGKPSWRIQIYRALNTIDHIGRSKYATKLEEGWTPGQAVNGLFSFGYKNLVFDQAITFTNWLREQYPEVKLFCDVDREIVAEYLGEKSTTYTPDTIRTLLATFKKLQEGLRAMNWIHEEIVPQEWVIEGRNPPRGPYAPDEATAIRDWIRQCDSEFGQALDFILSSGARIDETLHLRSDKVFVDEGRVELQGKGGRVRKIQMLQADVLKTLDLSQRFVYLTEQPGRLWKDGLERRVRQACEALEIRRRGVHGFRATAACEFVNIKSALGYTEMEARHELAMWLGHNPHRIEVTYAYVPKRLAHTLAWDV